MISHIISCLLVLLIPAGMVLAQNENADTSSETILLTDQSEMKEQESAPGELLIRANTAYDSGNHIEAISLYLALIEQGTCNGHIYYNLGNSYLRNGELGRAIAAYRNSQQLHPRDQDLAANLSFARRTAKDAIEAPQPSALISTLFFWHFTLSPGELASITLVVNLLFWAVLTLRLYRHGSEILKWTFYTLLLLLLALGGSLVTHYALPTQIAVVIPQEINVLTGPSDDAVVRFKLHAGSEVRVKDERENWLRIALPDGQQGWLEKIYVEVVG